MCRIDDADSATISAVTYPKARKQHICGECGRVIAPGEIYENCFMVFEDYPDTFKICAHCRVAAKWLSDNCGGYLYSQVIEEIEEHAQEYTYLAEPLLKLANDARKKWVGIPIPESPPPITVRENRG